ncbi:MAG: tyrosine-type recombinase/integrase [Pirellulaceae bacterium]
MLRFFEEHYRPLKLRSRAHNTIRLYRSSIKCFGKTLGRPARLADFADEAVSLHLARLMQDGYSPYSVNKERSQLLAMWGWAARKKFIDRWPDVEAERCPTRIPKAWLQNEVELLLAECQRQRGRISGIPAGDWWVALHRVIWDTAERIGAVMQIKWEYLDDAGWLLIPAELRKCKREDKHFQLGPDTLQSLDKIRQPERDLIFPWPFTTTLIYRRYKAILTQAGLSTDRRSKFHRMRRTVASYYEAAGGDATKLLGHANRSTTAGYLDPRVVVVKQPCEVIFRLRGKEVQP